MLSAEFLVYFDNSTTGHALYQNSLINNIKILTNIHI